MNGRVVILSMIGRQLSVYPELYAFTGPNIPDYRGQFLRGVGGKSAALGAQQDAGVYMPNANLALNGLLGGGAVSVSRPIQTSGGGGGGDGSMDSINGWATSSVNIPDTGSVNVVSYGSHSKNFTVTLNTGSGETRPVNKSVRYLIRARP